MISPNFDDSCPHPYIAPLAMVQELAEDAKKLKLNGKGLSYLVSIR
jgi:hypothetical protein